MKYVLYYRPRGEPPQMDVDRIRNVTGVRLLEEQSHVMLVDAEDGEALRSAVAAMPGWHVSMEKIVGRE